MHEHAPKHEGRAPAAEAIAEINGIIARIRATGAFDSELPHLLEIISKITSGAVPPDEGLKWARAIEQQRHDYH